MKIAVEIPDVIYKKLINGEIHFGGITSKNIFNYVKNGTPIETSEKAEENRDEISKNAMLEIEKASKSNWNSVLFKNVNELPSVTRQKINKILKNIRLDIALKAIPSDSDEYDYEAKWLNRGLRMALEVIDEYKDKIEESKYDKRRSDKDFPR